MKWRTDNPTEKIIVAQLCEDLGGRYEILYLNKKPYIHYDDSHGEEVPYSAIARWMSLYDRRPIGYDPEYMQSLIDKATESWKGVDVKEFLEDIRPSDESIDLDSEIYNWLKEHGSDETRQLIEMTARHFWEMGRRDERCKMMKDAVEGFIEEPEYLLWKLHLEHDLEGTFVAEHNLRDGDKVKVIIVKEGE